jgi:hypothetical protein
MDQTPCPRCWQPLRRPIHFEAPVYAFLLGGYLGDGSIVRVNNARQSMRLSVSLDDRMPDIQRAFAIALGRLLPTVSVRRHQRVGSSDITAHHHHLPCLFPQHGPGRKHHRRLLFEPWQIRLAHLHAWEVLRGLILTDGCTFTNWTTTGGRRYEYLTYDLANRSEDVLWLALELSEALGLVPTESARGIRWARRDDVRRLRRHIGTKQEVPLDDLPVVWDAGAACHLALAVSDTAAPTRPSASRCPDCEGRKSRGATRCRSCAGKAREPTKIAWPPVPALRAMVDDMGYAATGRTLGVSDNAVRQRLRRHG